MESADVVPQLNATLGENSRLLSNRGGRQFGRNDHESRPPSLLRPHVSPPCWALDRTNPYDRIASR